MPPISEIVAGYLGEKLVALAESAVRTHVIERWSRHRAQAFFQAFCASLLDVSVSDENLRGQLDALLADETRSEVVFDAYRAVCLSKSRTIGPRIIAFLTAELVIGESIASDEDDQIFAAAEALSDAEFVQFHEYVVKEARKAGRPTGPLFNRQSPLYIEVRSETFSGSVEDTMKYVDPLDYPSYVGWWGLKLKQLGLLNDEILEKSTRHFADSERYIDEPGVTRGVLWVMYVSPAALKLATLIERARGGSAPESLQPSGDATASSS